VLINFNTCVFFQGYNTKELVVPKEVFAANPSTKIWKFELSMRTLARETGISSGSTSVIVIINQLPRDGSCTVSPLNGIAFNTTFTISCMNWKDIDGSIEQYAFYGVLLNEQMHVGLGFSKNGELSAKFPQGAFYDSDKMKIYVKIVDNDDGVTYYDIPNPITVRAETTNLMNQLASMLKPDNSKSELKKSLASGLSQSNVQQLLSISSMLNTLSFNDKTSLNSSKSLHFCMNKQTSS
jgi:hypothetical protein